MDVILKWCCYHRIFTIYTRTLPLDVACRVWDMFCRDGDFFLFRTAIGGLLVQSATDDQLRLV